jgi:F-type H+-transporting ATPase subunit delta
MSQAAVAERYARALFELAAEAGQLTQASEQITRFAEAYTGSEELRTVLSNPIVDPANRDAILKEVGGRVGASPLVLNAVRLMSARKRLGALPDIARMLTRLSDDKAGVLRATVTSAGLLPEDYYQALASELEKRYARKILLERRQDPSLLGGVVTRIGDHTIDGSVRGRLAALQRQLLATT